MGYLSIATVTTHFIFCRKFRAKKAKEIEAFANKCCNAHMQLIHTTIQGLET